MRHDGTPTVAKAQLDATANDASRAYGATDPTLGCTVAVADLKCAETAVVVNGMYLSTANGAASTSTGGPPGTDTTGSGGESGAASASSATGAGTAAKGADAGAGSPGASSCSGGASGTNAAALVVVQSQTRGVADGGTDFRFDASASFEKPAETKLSYTARLAEGAPLPSWMSLAAPGVLKGVPPTGATTALEVVVTAQTDAGASASTALRIGPAR